MFFIAPRSRFIDAGHRSEPGARPHPPLRVKRAVTPCWRRRAAWWALAAGLGGFAPVAAQQADTGAAGGGGGGGHTPPGSSEHDWLLPARTYEGTRYSSLDQINASTVQGLREIWRFETGIKTGHEGQPLFVEHTLYVVTPFPNALHAFDLSDPRHPMKKWSFLPQVDVAAAGKACCDVVNRGASYADGKIVFNSLDNTTWAVDARSGREVWHTRLGDVETGQTITMAPLVVGDRVLVGNSGGEMGVRGWLVALDLKNGKEVWRAYSTGPDADVRLGPEFKPFYPFMRGKDLGVRSWPKNQWKLGGGAVWGWVTYDPASRTVFYGTSNPGVWNPDMRPGNNFWSTAIFARDVATGDARWAYQMTPHDAWDYDGVNESIVVDLPMGGASRSVLVHFDRNGFAYTIDRRTGEVLVAEPYQAVNWAKGVDLKSGLPQEVKEKRTHQGRMTTNICPSSIGARDQQPAAFSPRTGLFYTPAVNLCMDYGGMKASYIAGTPYVGAAVRMFAGPGGNRGEFLAWDAVAGKKVWGIKEKFPVWSGALATGGDLIFYGTEDGWFKAVDAKNGKELWRHHFESGVLGNPMTFLGRDGKQYIAVYSGVGGWYGAIVPAKLSKDDPYAALGAVGASADLPDHTKPGGAVHLFALP